MLELSLADIGSYLEDEEVIQMRDQLLLYTWVHVEISWGNSGPREMTGTPWSLLALDDHGEWAPLFVRTISLR